MHNGTDVLYGGIMRGAWATASRVEDVLASLLGDCVLC